MCRLFAIVTLLTILAACSAPRTIIPASTELPRPTVTPLGKGVVDISAVQIAVLTRTVPVTRLAIATVTLPPAAPAIPEAKPVGHPPSTRVAPAQAVIIPSVPVAATARLSSSSTPSLTPTALPSATPTATLTPTATPTSTSTATPTSTPSYGGPWFLAGSMTRSRGWHSATVLGDGRVLIAGGYTALDEDTASAEIFDPGSNTFSPTGSLNTARHMHSATLLPDGRVLVIAGYALGWLSSAEIYNPANGQWSMTQPVYAHGVCHSATLLQDGRVLVFGGAIQSNSPGADDRVEIFDPFTNRWQAAARHENTEACHTATRLLDGRVLIAGGNADPAIYDPIRNAWQPAGKLAIARHEAQAVLLPNGRVLLTGGIDAQRTAVFNSVEIYDPLDNTWQLAAPMTQPRYEHTATVLPDGRVLIVGGYKYVGGYESALLNTAEVYNYQSDAWSTLAPLNTGRVIHATTLLPDGRILVTGGETSRGTILSSAEILKP